MEDKQSVSLLYYFGYSPLDKLMEEKFQGEDMYVNVFYAEDKLWFEIEDYSYEVNLESIKLIDLQYLDSIMLFNINDEECQFSFEDKITKELLDLLFALNVDKKIPKFLNDRHEQFIENEGLFELVIKLQEELPSNDFVHFYPNIDEMALKGIVESFAPEAITEIPLVYIKYVDNEDRELGLLITTKKMYAPEKSIALKDINSMAYDERFNITDTIDLYVNSEYFTNMKLIIWDRSLVSFSSVYRRVFKTDEIFNVIKEISDFVIRKNNEKNGMN